MDNETKVNPIPHNAPASRESVVAAVNQLRRISELKAKSPITLTNGETIELRHAEKSLSEFFLAHANEFLAVWFAVADEYEVLINFAAKFFRRLNAINQPQPIQPKQQ